MLEISAESKSRILKPQVDPKRWRQQASMMDDLLMFTLQQENICITKRNFEKENNVTFKCSKKAMKERRVRKIYKQIKSTMESASHAQD